MDVVTSEILCHLIVHTVLDFKFLVKRWPVLLHREIWSHCHVCHDMETHNVQTVYTYSIWGKVAGSTQGYKVNICTKDTAC